MTLTKVASLGGLHLTDMALEDEVQVADQDEGWS